ncbi:hypothetical protein M8494_17180 [Serratia ureilytica]
MAKPPSQEQGAAPHALRQCGERNSGDQRPHRMSGDELRQTFRSNRRDRRSTPAGMISVGSVIKAAIANASRPQRQPLAAPGEQISSFDSSILSPFKIFRPLRMTFCIMRLLADKRKTG